MDGMVDSVMHALGSRWASATPTDFGTLALVIVISAWFFTRFYGDR